MNTSWSGYQPTSGPGDPTKRPMYRASTAPVPVYSTHPRALMPGQVPQQVERPNLFFTNAARMPIAHDVRHSHFPPPPLIPPSPYHTQSRAPPPPPPPPPIPPLPSPYPTPHPGAYFRRSLTSPPPVPPKPSAPHYIQAPLGPQSSIITPFSSSTSSNLSPDFTDGGDELAIALALSKSSQPEEQHIRDKISTQEEEELERALKESLLLTSLESPVDDFVQGSSRGTPSQAQSLSPSSNLSSDEAFARMLAMEQDRGIVPTEASVTAAEPSGNVAKLPRYPQYRNHVREGSGNFTSRTSSSKVSLSEDEILAHKLALEDGDGDMLPSTSSPENTKSDLPYAEKEPTSSLPKYSPRIGAPSETGYKGTKEIGKEGAYAHSPHAQDRLAPTATPTTRPDDHNNTTVSPIFIPPVASTPDLPAYAETLSLSGSEMSSPTRSRPPESVVPPSSLSEAESSRRPSQSSVPTPNVNSAPVSPSLVETTPSRQLGRASSTPSLSDMHQNGSHPSDHHSSIGSNANPSVVNSNHFVDRALFMGVSIGFTPPKISVQQVIMQEVMPNIISLPYGKCPPLHLQGPNWRHLLRLMARLSGTRLEPTVEALAIAKTDLKLRTVIQFIRPHPSSPNWRTVLYFTIDYPMPRNAKNSVNDLPHSYSLSSIPTLLRDASDTVVSKTYTIPTSGSVPYPNLPITFPNLAIYLQAALEESRRYINDSSSGNRKLAKMVQTCYPSEEAIPDAPERSSVGGLFKRVIGRNNRSSRRGGGNEDTYELVTPFVPDEWG